MVTQQNLVQTGLLITNNLEHLFPSLKLCYFSTLWIFSIYSQGKLVNYCVISHKNRGAYSILTVDLRLPSAG